MSNSLTEETTSLKTKVFKSSLEWNIENFNEYSKCDIGSITSRKICIEGTQASWSLSVHPNGFHNSPLHDKDYFSVSVQIKDKNASQNHCFKIEVKTNLDNEQEMSPSHRNLDESDVQLISLNEPKPKVWTEEYTNIGKETHLEFFDEKFISVHDLPQFLFCGTLRLIAMVSMKVMKIDDFARIDRNHEFD